MAKYKSSIRQPKIRSSIGPSSAKPASTNSIIAVGRRPTRLSDTELQQTLKEKQNGEHKYRAARVAPQPEPSPYGDLHLGDGAPAILGRLGHITCSVASRTRHPRSWRREGVSDRPSRTGRKDSGTDWVGGPHSFGHDKVPELSEEASADSTCIRRTGR